MPRTARDAKLDTRAARLRLAIRREPYWRSIQEGRAIGYRRVAGTGGSWIARHYGASVGRTYRALGAADDFGDADGANTLSFAQAQAKAQDWFAELARTAGQVVVPLTVADAVASYLSDYEARGGRSLVDTKRACAAHILPAFGNRRLGELTTKALQDWHRALALTPARVRSKGGASKPGTRMPDSDEARRARRATANRILTILKAALNHAFREGHVASDDAWRRVRPFANVDAPRVRYLTDNESRRLLNNCAEDLRTLVTAALLTGCRYGELATLRATDVDLAARVLSVSGKVGGRTVVLTDEARGFFAAVMAGRDPQVTLMRRSNGEPWGKSHQFRPLREACVAAAIKPAVSFHILRHTHASRLAMQRVPMAVVAAQLGHANLTMTTKHYAHLSPGYIADTIRAAFAPLGIGSGDASVEPSK